MYDVIGAAVLIFCLLSWWAVAFIGGAIREARENGALVEATPWDEPETVTWIGLRTRDGERQVVLYTDEHPARAAERILREEAS